MQDLDRHIEAILFASDHPVAVADLVGALNRALELELDPNVVINHLETLLVKYEEDFFPFKIVQTGGGYRFLTKEAYHGSVSVFLNLKSRRRLSTAAMETLAIIAYRQPISKTEVENIRGVNCDYSIQKLLDKELIRISGRSEGPGKPLQYSVSENFMDYFGINSMDELPSLREFAEEGESIGVAPEAEEELLQQDFLPGEAGQDEAPVEDEAPAEDEAPVEDEAPAEEASAEEEPSEDDSRPQ